MRTFIAAWRCTALTGLAIVTAFVAVFVIVPLIPGLGLGVVVLVPWPIEGSRRFINAARRLVSRWCSVGIGEPYKPAPPSPQPRPDGLFEQDGGLFKRAWWPVMSARIGWIFGDRATAKDLLWLVLHPAVGTLLAGAPLALVVAAAVEAARGRWWALFAVPVAVVTAPAFLWAYGRWCKLLLAPVADHRRARMDARKRWWGEHVIALARLAVVGAAGLLHALASLAMTVAVALTYTLGLVMLFQPAIDAVRAAASLRRRLAGAWSHRAIEQPYRPAVEPTLEADGRWRYGRRLHRTRRWAAYSERHARLTRDPATWRDWIAGLIEPLTGAPLALLAPAAVVGGTPLLIAPGIAGADPLLVLGGLLVIAAGLASAPVLLRLHGGWTALLLVPTAAARLSARVERLTEARSDVITDQAAEVRRIERDLHDGAQARLIAVGLTLDAAQRALDDDPQQARRLVAQAREASATALGELRSLVRGVHPPVLAERGLGDAVRALALDCPLPVTVSVDLPTRLPPAIESAAYFAIAEAVANAVRHSGADGLAVTIAADRLLRITVHDDGRGGADPGAGTGLAGLRRRLGAFDGSLAISSPAGGPTVLTMEIPCVLSSPKT